MAQKFITKEVERRLEKHPFGSQDGKGADSEVIVKFFNPYGLGTWLITEAEKQEDGDTLMYGLCHIYEWEWGYVSLRELEAIRVKIGPYRMPLERDMYCAGATVRELAHGYEIVESVEETK